MYLLLIVIQIYPSITPEPSMYFRFFSRLAENYLLDFKSLPNFFIAMCIFYFFQHLQIGSSRTINFIATGAFSTYIIHQTPALIYPLWNHFYQGILPFESINPVWYIFFVVFSLYALCLAIETIRRKYIEPMILKSRFVKTIEVKLDEFYS